MPSRVAQRTVYLSLDVDRWLEEKAKEMFGDKRGAVSHFLEYLLRREMAKEKKRAGLI